MDIFKKISRKIAACLLLVLFGLIMWSGQQALAVASADEVLWGGQETEIAGNLNLGNQDPRLMVASVINFALGFLGIIAVVLIIYAGFKWMTAAGNDDAISQAKGIMTAAIIGLVIILSAWAISRFVVDALYNATTGA